MTHMLEHSRKLFLLVFILTSIARYVQGSEHTIHVAADPWCPYNCTPDDEKPGFLIELAREALSLSGYKLEYQVTNWARAKRMVQHGEVDGIVGMTLSENSKHLYTFSDQPLGRSQICFFRRKNDDWSFKSITSLENKTLGWVNDFGFANNPEIEQWIIDKKNTKQLITISGKKVQSRLIQLLVKNRIDTFAEDRNVIMAAAQKIGLNSIEVAGCTSKYDFVHVAFSLKSPKGKTWASALSKGINQMRDNGTLNSILLRYGLSEETWLK